MLKKYKTEITQYSQNISLIANCNAITFVNTGTTNMYVDKYLLIPGQSIGVSGNNDEIDITHYNLQFTNNLGNCSVIRKIFV